MFNNDTGSERTPRASSRSQLAYLDAFFPDVPALYTQQDFEAALRAVGFTVRKERPIGLPQPVAYHLRRVAGRAARNLLEGHGSRLLCLMMGPAAFRLIPDGMFNRCALHCWDTWPDNFHLWDALFTRFRTEIAFFSSRQATARFQERFPAMRCHWMPDGSMPERHQHRKPLPNRSIDVLELGRRYDRYHNAITPQLSNLGMKHLYESPPGRLVFPGGRESLLGGLADSKVVVCFPASMTNPARGAIETMTSRYFEAMSSGCVIVGHCPADLRELLGYNPLIEADMENPAAQISQVLAGIEEYRPLVGRNIAAMAENTWVHRAHSLKKILEDEK